MTMDQDGKPIPQRLGVSSLNAPYNYVAIISAENMLTFPSQKRELGPHADEQQMPEALWSRLIDENADHQCSNVVTHLAHLLSRATAVQIAYLCTATVIQVSKIPDEGNTFCGYRNIQMLVLALDLPVPNLANGQSSDRRDSAAPTSTAWTVPTIQRLIEQAWIQGHNASGKIQTGGILGTRKHIGTLEVEALLRSLSVPCEVRGFYGRKAVEQLLDYVEQHFCSDCTTSEKPTQIVKSGVHQTAKPSIYLQRPGHSMTIIGLERTKGGSRRLLVFDPAWRPPKLMRAATVVEEGAITETKAARGKASPLSAIENSAKLRQWWTLRQYRKSERFLRRWDAFETVAVVS